MKKILVVLMTLGISTSAFATTLFGVSVMKYQTETEGTTLTSNKSDVMYYDAKLGFASEGLYLGGIYSARGMEDNNRTSYGVSVGYHSGGFFIDGNYFIASSIDRGTTTLQQGSGFGADLGYNWMMSSSFYMGLELSYKSFTYKEVTIASVDIEQENKEKSEMYPMINVGFAF